MSECIHYEIDRPEFCVKEKGAIVDKMDTLQRNNSQPMTELDESIRHVCHSRQTGLQQWMTKYQEKGFVVHTGSNEFLDTDAVQSPLNHTSRWVSLVVPRACLYDNQMKAVETFHGIPGGHAPYSTSPSEVSAGKRILAPRCLHEPFVCSLLHGITTIGI